MSYPTNITFVDTETTGLNPEDNYVIQLAYIKVEHSPQTLDMKVLKQAEYKIQLPKGVSVSPEAARVNGYKEEVWQKEAVNPLVAYQDLIKQLGWSTFGGQNPQFDYRFLDKEFSRQRLGWPKMANYGLWAVDMLARPLQLKGLIPNARQETLCKFFGIGEQTHDALDDVRQCVQIYSRLLWLSIHGLAQESIEKVKKEGGFAIDNLS